MKYLEGVPKRQIQDEIEKLADRPKRSKDKIESDKKRYDYNNNIENST